MTLCIYGPFASLSLCIAWVIGVVYGNGLLSKLPRLYLTFSAYISPPSYSAVPVHIVVKKYI